MKTTGESRRNGKSPKATKAPKLRVLILEDNPADAELMERQLKKDGIAFVSRRVDTRSGFLQALKAFQPELILADYTLPKFDALQALELRREKWPLTPVHRGHRQHQRGNSGRSA